MIEIRKITVDDAESFSRMHNSIASERKFFSMFEGASVERAIAWLSNDIAKGNHLYAAVDGNEVVGWCEICRIDSPAHRHCGELNMGLVAAYRGQGFGRALIMACLNDAASAGISRVSLSVFGDNDRARTLYESYGFVHEGVMRNYVLIDGKYNDLLLMARFS